MRTAIAQHAWVKHTITPVSALEGADGEPVVFVDPDEQTTAEDMAVYGCGICQQPMATAFGTPCEGAN